MKRILIVAVIMAMLMSGCSVMMSTMEQGVTQPTVEEMLAQALQLSNAGNYEEAILLYEAIIEIEPNNYEAGYGLGHAYRSVGRTMDAISILKKAAKLSTDDKRAMYELGYAYLDAGEYSNARDAVRMEKTGDDMAPEVAILLVLSYAAEGSYDTAVSFFENKSVQDYFMSMNENKVIYFGPYNAAGQMHGKGVGIYDRGQYIYCGEYKNGQKSGHGVWLKGIRLDEETGLPQNGTSDSKLDSKMSYAYFEGAWENDKPNGYGENHVIYPREGNLSATRSGNYTDGYENGEMTVYWADHSATYTSNMGVRVLIDKTYKPKDGPTQYYYTICSAHKKCGDGWTLKEYQLDAQWGVMPWGATKVTDPNAAAE